MENDNRDLDRRCAEILGWTVIRNSPLSDVIGAMPGSKVTKEIPHYSTDANASRELLEWASGEEDWWKFPNSLRAILAVDPNQDLLEPEVMKFMLATPRQIAEAFVECFGVEK